MRKCHLGLWTVERTQMTPIVVATQTDEVVNNELHVLPILV